MKYKKINEGITKMNPSDPMNPEIQIDGYGILDLKQVERDVATTLVNIAKRSQSSTDAMDWNAVHYLFTNEALAAKLEAIISTYDELDSTRQKGGSGSRGLDKLGTQK
jgi:hypothetical protein